MTWPYHLVSLSSDQKHERRALLDRYGSYAQLSVLVPILGYQLYALSWWAYRRTTRSRAVYSALSHASEGQPVKTSLRTVAQRWRSFLWWLNDEAAPGWGLRQHWIGGAVWGIWMLFLCVHNTGDDYLHVTKRFGIIAASQFPLHYLLAMKTPYSPLAFIFRTSHERLNPWHRLCGRIIASLLALHAAWYINYYIQKDSLQKLTSRASLTGLIALSLLSLLTVTSLDILRHRSYRLFFNVHLIVAIVLLPLLFFHVEYLRLYILESIAIYAFDRLTRRLNTTTTHATVTRIPHSTLLQLTIPLPEKKLPAYHFAPPGQHVYLTILPGQPSLTGHRLLANPFSVAHISNTSATLVVRARTGPMTRALTGMVGPDVPVALEGPLGTPRGFFSRLARETDRILLVAGGVGGTFAVPVYLSLREEWEKGPERVTFAWAVRSAAETAWAVELDGEDVLQDENVRVHVTGHPSSLRGEYEEGGQEGDDGVEMDELGAFAGGNAKRGRPDLRMLVDEVFGYGEERVAVVFCGPVGMGRELRGHVGRWVRRGREVWWHEERFGW